MSAPIIEKQRSRSLDDIAREYGKMVSSVCRRMISDEEIARDAVQQAWVASPLEKLVDMETISCYPLSMERERIRVVKELLRLGAFLQREANRLLADNGLNQQQFVVLKEIQERGPISQKDVCSALLFEKSNVSKIVKKLEKNGLVRSAYAREDTRVMLLSITNKGNAVSRQCMKRLNRWNTSWLEALDEKEIAQIGIALHKLSDVA